MKKFRMMLPVLAVVLAMASAVAGSFMPGVSAYYRVGSSGCSTITKLTDQSGCVDNLESDKPQCTVTDGINHPGAFSALGCGTALRYNP
jgi:hypothetical protein